MERDESNSTETDPCQEVTENLSLCQDRLEQVGQSRDDISTILENIGDGFITLDGQLRITYVNRRASEFLGKTREQLLGHRVHDQFPDIIGSPFLENFRKALEQKVNVAFEEFYPPLGKWFEVRAYPFQGGLSIHFLDISSRKTTQGALAWEARVNASLADLSESLLAGPSIDQLSDQVLRHAQSLTSSPIGFVGFIDPEQGHLVVPTFSPRAFPAHPIPEGRAIFKEFDNLFGWVVANREELLSNDAAHDSRARGIPQGHQPIRRFLSVPAMAGQALVGVLCLANADQDYTEWDLSLLRRLASLYAIAIQHHWADQALRESQERFRSIFENAEAGMNTVSPEGCFLQVNQGFCRFLGYAEEELVGRHVEEVTHPDDCEKTRQLLDEVRSGCRKSFAYQKRWLRKDGSVVWGQASSGWVFAQDGRPLYGIGLVQDITERRRAVEEVEASRDKVEAILRSAGEGIIVSDLRNRVEMMNPAAEKLLGVSLAEALGRPINSLIRAEHFRERLALTLVDGADTQTLELQVPLGPAGAVRDLQARLSAVTSHEGVKTGVITTLLDVTREREVERMKNEFISTAAHELRTPLASVMGFAELLLGDESWSVEQQREFLGYIYEKGQILEHTVDNLLDLSRIETGRVIFLEKSSCDLNELITKLVTQYQQESNRHSFATRLPEGALALEVDRVRTVQVLENLLSNAVKYSPAGGRVMVAAAPEGASLQISVEDEGIGMTPEQLERVFDKFYRADSSNTAVSGLGLGMSIARHIVEAHGGRIWVESEPARGTRVTFTLPMTPLSC